MTLEELKVLIESLGIKSVYGSFNEKEETPYICYRETNALPFYAGGEIFHQGKNMELEYISNKRDIDTELKIEAVLIEKEILYSKEIEAIEKNKINSTNYTFAI